MHGADGKEVVNFGLCDRHQQLDFLKRVERQLPRALQFEQVIDQYWIAWPHDDRAAPVIGQVNGPDLPWGNILEFVEVALSCMPVAEVNFPYFHLAGACSADLKPAADTKTDPFRPGKVAQLPTIDSELGIVGLPLGHKISGRLPA